ncbi:hypothetical protein CH361_05075 [Leptospira brenneri]|nr:hypothetical protein CH361_05075 [Leptospira brenneri]
MCIAYIPRTSLKRLLLGNKRNAYSRNIDRDWKNDDFAANMCIAYIPRTSLKRLLLGNKRNAYSRSIDRDWKNDNLPANIRIADKNQIGMGEEMDSNVVFFIRIGNSP